MNKQRKVLITITYNEMGIIIDTKAEEVAQPEHEQNTPPEQGKSDKFGVKMGETCTDTISRKAAIDAIEDYLDEYSGLDEEGYHGEKWCAMQEAKMTIEDMPSAQPEIVRCKDCKHWEHDHTCREHSLVSPMMANEFCSRAERREE